MAREHSQTTQPSSIVVLPLSPNQGILGHDGHAESKISLEVLLNKWWSEDCNDYLSLCGAVISWTRGTGLTSNNNVLATGIGGDLRIRNFGAAEMVWHFVDRMDAAVAMACDLLPLVAYLSGGPKVKMNLKLCWTRSRTASTPRLRCSGPYCVSPRTRRRKGGLCRPARECSTNERGSRSRNRRCLPGRTPQT